MEMYDYLINMFFVIIYYGWDVEKQSNKFKLNKRNFFQSAVSAYVS
jgi:hypothetical protein